MLAAINATEQDGENAHLGLIELLKKLLEPEPVSVETSRRAKATENYDAPKPEPKAAKALPVHSTSSLAWVTERERSLASSSEAEISGSAFCSASFSNE